MKKFRLTVSIKTADGETREGEYELEAESPEKATINLTDALKTLFNEQLFKCSVREITDETAQ